MPEAGSLLTAVETNTRSPQTIGLDTATPATGVLQSTFSPLVTLHFTGIGEPSATPEAPGPRNDGQFCAESVAAASHDRTTARAQFVDRMAYLSSTRVKEIELPIAVSVNVFTLSCSSTNVAVVPGCSTTPNVVWSRAESVN